MSLLPLLPFTSDADESVVRRAMRQLGRVRDVQRRADLQGALAVFAGDRFPGVDRVATSRVLVKSRFFERLEALAEKRAEAKVRAELVMRLVRLRLGRGASRWSRAVSAADMTTLDALFDAVAETTSKDQALDALEGVLGRRAAPRGSSRRATTSARGRSRR